MKRRKRAGPKGNEAEKNRRGCILQRYYSIRYARRSMSESWKFAIKCMTE